MNQCISLTSTTIIDFCFVGLDSVVVSCSRGGGTKEEHWGTHQRPRLRTFQARLRH